ncbi:MAG: lipoyl synthase [bacterium]|nr:lipoyl synthase [bacterium]
MPSIQKKPAWLKVRLPSGDTYKEVHDLIRSQNLHTVCSSARCPNLGECWGNRTATFMILGDICSRNCSFCAVTTGKPQPSDQDEPRRVAESVQTLELKYAVITSVTRDDLSDGGAAHFAATIKAIRNAAPSCKIEVLIPDFQGDESALEVVIKAQPDILNHNLETVPSLYPTVRPQADYRRSLQVLERAAAAGLRAKTGLMLGLGETAGEVDQAFSDVLSTGCRLLTIGQYLQPSTLHHPVIRYVTPDEFAHWVEVGRAKGFDHVEAGPLVRSSYHAHRQVEGIVG